MSLSIKESASGWVLEHITKWRNTPSEGVRQYARRVVALPAYIALVPLTAVEAGGRGSLWLIAKVYACMLSREKKEAFQLNTLKTLSTQAICAAMISVITFTATIQNIYVAELDLNEIERDLFSADELRNG